MTDWMTERRLCILYGCKIVRAASDSQVLQRQDNNSKTGRVSERARRRDRAIEEKGESEKVLGERKRGKGEADARLNALFFACI